MSENLEITKPRELYLGRLRAIKGGLPKNYTAIIASNLKQYDTVKGHNRIRNVMIERVVDVEIIEALEKIHAGTLKLKAA